MVLSKLFLCGIEGNGVIIVCGFVNVADNLIKKYKNY